jgi:hypothetical protein
VARAPGRPSPIPRRRCEARGAAADVDRLRRPCRDRVDTRHRPRSEFATQTEPRRTPRRSDQGRPYGPPGCFAVDRPSTPDRFRRQSPTPPPPTAIPLARYFLKGSAPRPRSGVVDRVRGELPAGLAPRPIRSPTQCSSDSPVSTFGCDRRAAGSEIDAR